FGTKRVRVNQVYQEYIADKFHVHMNSTRWVTLTEFAKHLGRTGVARVDDTEKGWFVAWIDSSPKALAKAEASKNKDRATTSDEQRERLLIAEQIDRAAVETAPADPSSSSSTTPPIDEGLKRDEGAEKVVLSFAPKPAAAPTAAPISFGGAKINPLKANPLKANPLKANPLRANPLKASSTAGAGAKRPAAAMSAAERLILEEQQFKRRRMDRDNGGQ
ncbi:hypothetical protein FIBSPDRAFT_858567, partial [Athelia psychrophila]